MKIQWYNSTGKPYHVVLSVHVQHNHHISSYHGVETLYGGWQWHIVLGNWLHIRFGRKQMPILHVPHCTLYHLTVGLCRPMYGPDSPVPIKAKWVWWAWRTGG